MKISILTPSYNQGQFIEQTILSVLAQQDPDFEHLVLDGASSDETVAVLRRHGHLRWVSEQDGGQSDALRKGLQMCDGDIIGWINSDDFYDAGAFSAVRKAFAQPEVQWVVGDLSYVFDESGDVVRDRSQLPSHVALVNNPDIVRQQPTFFRRRILEEAGGWDPKYHMTMDYDLWTRIARLADPVLIEQNLAFFRFHRGQKTTAKNVETQARELAEIMAREGASAETVAQLLRRKRSMLRKLKIKNFLIGIGLIPGRYASQPLRTRQR
jgi:glycosyltransferase involved in cell wall biosynthesis